MRTNTHTPFTPTHTHTHTYIHACMHTYLFTYLPYYIPTYLHVYIPWPSRIVEFTCWGQTCFLFCKGYLFGHVHPWDGCLHGLTIPLNLRGIFAPVTQKGHCLAYNGRCLAKTSGLQSHHDFDTNQSTWSSQKLHSSPDRRKFRSQTSDNMQRWKGRGGKSQRGEVKKWEDKRWRKSEETRCKCAKR